MPDSPWSGGFPPPATIKQRGRVARSSREDSVRTWPVRCADGQVLARGLEGFGYTQLLDPGPAQHGPGCIQSLPVINGLSTHGPAPLSTRCPWASQQQGQSQTEILASKADSIDLKALFKKCEELSR